MPLHVICPGCLKRFRVSTRFAGMSGSCPNCKQTIEIPKNVVDVHEGDTTRSNVFADKKINSNHRIPSHPIARIGLQPDSSQTLFYTLGVLAVLLLTFLLGCIPMYDFFRAVLGVLGLCAATFPLTLFGYHTLRDRDVMISLDQDDLIRRSYIVSAGYVILWIMMEYCLVAANIANWAGMFVSSFFLTIFAVLGAILTTWLLELRIREAFLHYCVFAFSIIFLRFLLGLGWIWQPAENIRHTAAPPPPFLPGM